MGLKLAPILTRFAALRDDFLVWSGVALLALAVAQVHVGIAIGLVGLALILDGILGRRRT